MSHAWANLATAHDGFWHTFTLGVCGKVRSDPLADYKLDHSADPNSPSHLLGAGCQGARVDENLERDEFVEEGPQPAPPLASNSRVPTTRSSCLQIVVVMFRPKRASEQQACRRASARDCLQIVAHDRASGCTASDLLETCTLER